MREPLAIKNQMEVRAACMCLFVLKKLPQQCSTFVCSTPSALMFAQSTQKSLHAQTVKCERTRSPATGSED